MKSLKLFLVSIVIITLMAGGWGCNRNKPKKQTASQIVSGMRLYLSEKYGYIDCEEEGFIASGWDHPYDRLYLSTTIDGVQESFHVERHKKDDKYVYEDNYFGFLVREEFEKKISETACKYFPECKVFAVMQSTNYPNSLKAGSTLEDLFEVKDQIRYIDFFVFVDETFGSEEEFTSAAESFVDEWELYGIPSWPRVIYITHDGYKTIERENDEDIINDNLITKYRRIVN